MSRDLKGSMLAYKKLKTKFKSLTRRIKQKKIFFSMFLKKFKLNLI